MNKKMTEQEFLACFDDAVKFGHIFVTYQPKINHCTGRMIGAEALMRWTHPAYGMQYPSDFIPVLEKNDLIYRADLAVFESVCKFQRSVLDSGEKPVPVSVNMSRYDIYRRDYAQEIEKLRIKYDVPVKYIHVEITETSAIGGMDLITSVLKKLHEYGYVVEMDDFGSGYSSLNILKDLSVDVIKLDMRFLSGSIGGRGGTILNAVVQMAKWLGTPVIAEGVETLEQADYMKSIGCKYIQGYLYSKPVGEDEFREKLKQLDYEPLVPPIDLVTEMDAGRFWDPKSMETLVFNNFVGGAVIFSYQNGKAEILRVNKKYVKEIGMNMLEQDIIDGDPWECMDSKNRRIYEDTLKRAISSNEEESCETWRLICSKTCGEDRICIRSYIRLIGKTETQYLFYAMVQNITAEKKRWDELYESERKFRFASEQANVYAWEYDISTKEMRPCFRCMRDLNLPPLVENYPEPAIEVGIFPPDYADMYREWMRKLDTGEVDTLEGIIPLTVGRVPFHVRYTLERDENGKPLKAYGSATLVVDQISENGQNAQETE
ncbi:MAG: EAL domain-containing protein [Ruminococcus sp.]|nr:EAL domain-containing protein [Ruminococcus sp.]